MQIRFNPSGTDEKRDQLKARLDFYPGPAEKSYAQHYVRMPVIPDGGYPGKVNEMGDLVDQVDYDAWLAGLPHIWRVNPALCVFVGVDENITKKLLGEFIEDVYKPDVLATIDDIMSRPSTPEQPHLSAHLISPYMRGKTRLSAAKTTSFDEAAKAYINQRLAGFQVKGSSGGKIEDIKPHSIDVGPGTSYTTALAARTAISQENSANADGTLDTWQLYYAVAGTGVKVATFYVVSGNYLSTRDYETIGNVPAGSTQTFTAGISTDVLTGDYAGQSWTTGNPGRLISVGNIWYNASNEYIPCTNQLFSTYGFGLSIYGTGIEGGIFYQSVGSGSLTSASVINRLISKSPGAGAVGISSAVSNIFRQLMAVGSGTVGLAGALSNIFKRFASVGSGSLTSAGTLGIMTAKSIGSGAVSIAGTLNRLTVKTVGSGAVGIASTLGRLIAKGVGSGSLTIASTLGRMIARGVGAGAIGLSSILTPVLIGATVFYQNVGSGAVAIAGTVNRLIIKTIGSGAVGLTSTLGRLVSRAVGSGALTIASTLGLMISRTVGSGSVGLASTLGRLIAKGVGAGAVGISGALSSIYGIIKTIALTLAARIRSFTLKSRTTSFTLPARTRSFTLPERD